VTDILPALRALLAVQPPGYGARDTLERAVAELEHLYRQRDDLQTCNSRVVRENRDLRAQLAGHPVVRVKRVGDPELSLPAYATDGAAGMDLRADVRALDMAAGTSGVIKTNSSTVKLIPGARVRIPCGFAFEIPEGWEGQVRPRSGWTERGLVVFVGTVDCDFRGGVGIHVWNIAAESVDIQQGDRIAQLVICPAPQARLEETAELSETARGGNGFGSTGTR
jgi:dUTP pyrophosphatase